MKIIAGLGNPGQEYSATRHNVGFMTVDALAKRWEASPWRSKFEAQVAEAQLGEEKVLLVKPQTFMNLSGNAVGQILRWYKCAVSDVTAVYDDMDIPVGTARLRMRGSSGGHRGVESLLVQLGAEEFARVRVGVGRPLPGWTVVNHVLAPFSPEERRQIDAIIERLEPAARCIVAQGIERAMSRYSFKAPKKKAAESAREEEKQ